uniref:translation initiation factor IF-3, mitochondrial-like isoform X1 n=1 Tax=Myxine glutinosa TaxID=7769 RepID=UPI00358E8CC5
MGAFLQARGLYLISKTNIIVSIIAPKPTLPAPRLFSTLLSLSLSAPLAMSWMNQCCRCLVARSISKSAGFVIQGIPGIQGICAISNDHVTCVQGPLRNKGRKNVRDPFASVGRVINAPIVELQDTSGESLGHMSRAEALGRTDKLYLRLVVINERRDPPVYRMMSSQDILAIQMDKRAKDKAKTKTGTFCTKELRFTSMIEKSHLGVKQNQLVRWLQKGPCHIRITITRGNKSTSVEDVKACLDEFLHPLLEDSVTFVSKPRPVQNERALLCIIRKMTDKEMSQNRKLQSAEQPSSRTPAMKGSGLVRNQTQEIDQNSSNSLTYQYGFKDEK